jgi:hypothetical protein
MYYLITEGETPMSTAKHGTQISLEPWQYEILMEQSRKKRKSLALRIKAAFSFDTHFNFKTMHFQVLPLSTG